MPPEADRDRPIALIVEDDNESLETRRQLFAAAGFQPIGAMSPRDAIRQFRSTPTIDIVITDINLQNKNPLNRAGVAVATEIRQQRPDLPVMGLSACIDDLQGHERKLFTEWLPKGTFSVETLETKLLRWRADAIAYRRGRTEATRRQLDAMRQAGALPDAQIETMCGFLPGTHLEGPPAHSGPDDEYVTPDEILRRAGWRLHLVEAGFSVAKSDDADSLDIRTVSAVPFWIREEGPHWNAVLHGHSCIYTVATLEQEAVERALSLMCGYHRGFVTPEKPLVQEVKALREYLRGIFSEGV